MHPDVQSAHSLAKKIQAGLVENGTPVRDLYRKQWSFLGSATLVKGALDILVECGWVKIETVDTDGRSAEVVTLNPELVK